jgi:hypothetical protein
MARMDSFFAQKKLSIRAICDIRGKKLFIRAIRVIRGKKSCPSVEKKCLSVIKKLSLPFVEKRRATKKLSLLGQLS